MIRRLNYTGREKIGREYISIFLDKKIPGRPLSCDIKLDLSDFNFPPESNVFLEAYDNYSAMYFELGKVQNAIFSKNLELDEIIQEDAIKFRVKVVDQTDKHGKILAVANNLITHEPQAPHSIIAVSYEDLGNRIWELRFQDSGQDIPILRINNHLEKIVGSEIVRDNTFFALVYPAIVREIMQKIILIDNIVDLDGEDWQNLWLRYIVNDCGAELPDEKWIGDEIDDYIDEINEWIDSEVVESFCRKWDVKDKIEQIWGE